MYIFWAAIFGFGAWTVAALWLFPPAVENLRQALREDKQMQRTRTELARANPENRLGLTQALLQQRRTRNGSLLEGVVWGIGGLAVCMMGIGFLRIGFSAGQTSSLVFGTLFLGAAFGLFEHLRRNWQKYANAGHGSSDLKLSRLHYAGIVIGLFGGCMILAFGL